MQGISCLAEELLSSQEGLCSVGFVGWLVGWLVGRSVGWSVGLSVGRSVGWQGTYRISSPFWSSHNPCEGTET
jgi:hypothetical protein